MVDVDMKDNTDMTDVSIYNNHKNYPLIDIIIFYYYYYFFH